MGKGRSILCLACRVPGDVVFRKSPARFPQFWNLHAPGTRSKCKDATREFIAAVLAFEAINLFECLRSDPLPFPSLRWLCVSFRRGRADSGGDPEGVHGAKQGRC